MTADRLSRALRLIEAARAVGPIDEPMGVQFGYYNPDCIRVWELPYEEPWHARIGWHASIDLSVESDDDNTSATSGRDGYATREGALSALEQRVREVWG